MNVGWLPDEEWTELSEEIINIRCCPNCKIPLEHDKYRGFYCPTCGYIGDGRPCKLKVVKYVHIEGD